MESGALAAVPEVLKQYFPDKLPFLIADDNTWQAAGKYLSGILENHALHFHTPYIFPGKPRLHPNSSYADQLSSLLPPDCVPIAVGSGVINDLVKRASGIAGHSVLLCSYGSLG